MSQGQLGLQNETPFKMNTLINTRNHTCALNQDIRPGSTMGQEKKEVICKQLDQLEKAALGWSLGHT